MQARDGTAEEENREDEANQRGRGMGDCSTLRVYTCIVCPCRGAKSTGGHLSGTQGFDRGQKRVVPSLLPAIPARQSVLSRPYSSVSPRIGRSAGRVLIEQAGGNENLVRCSFRAIFLPTSHLRKGETTWNMERGTWNVPLNVGIYCPRISEAGQERERRGLSPRSGMKTRTIFQRDPRGNT